MKKFLSASLIGVGVGEAAGVEVVAATAGDAAVRGVMPGTGDSPATAGLVATPGLIAAAGVARAAAGLAGAVTGGGGGGGWPKEFKARVTEQRLAISSVFIGLIGKFCSRLEFR
jgi:hypothetical protein